MMNKYLQRFITHLEVEKGYSENTIKTYTLILLDFLAFLSEHRTRLKKAGKEEISSYVRVLRNERQNASRTIRLKLETLRSFFNFLTDQVHLFSHNPISGKDFKYKVETKEL